MQTPVAAVVAEAAPQLSLEQRMESIEALALVIKGQRRRAIDGRTQSGIEQQWQEDEDGYEGLDGTSERNRMQKPRAVDGSFVDGRKKQPGRSTAIPNITRPYCDAAAARVADMLLPTDDRNWALRPTPKPTFIDGKDDMRGVADANGVPMMRPSQPHEVAQQPGVLSRISSAISGAFSGGQQPAPQPMQNVTVADMAEQAIERAKKSSEKAQTQIDDWLVECRYHAEVRKVIECTSRLGVGILKGPHPMRKRARAVKRGPTGFTVAIEEKIVPNSVAVSPWNFYPDPNCGEDIQKGQYTFEYDDITAKSLRELKGTPGYIAEMIEMCLTEGPIQAVDGRSQLKEGDTLNDNDLFGIWYYNGQITRKDMLAAGCECPEGKEIAPCVVTMVNDRVIKITMSVLDSGEFPYDVMVWQQKIGHWAGIGVARQIRTSQKGLTGAVRALQDNMGLASGPQIVVDRSKIEPADGKWHITPRKLWWKKIDGETVDDVSKAFGIVSIETRQAEILNDIQFWLRNAEDVTGLPMLIQGQQGKAPETLGGMTMLNNNASSVLRRIARTFDDRITEPHIGRYYEWLLLHGDEEAKGDFQIDARGSSALIERDMQNQAMMQILMQSPNPAFGLDPEKAMREVLKGMRLDPKAFMLDDEQKKARQNAPPPEDPRITAAKIMAQSKTEALGADAKNQEADRAMQQQISEREYELRKAEIAVKEMAERIAGELGAAQLTSAERQSLDTIKADLSGLSMKLQTQRELSAKASATDLHKHHNPTPPSPPPTEPAGRAQEGMAYEQ